MLVHAVNVHISLLGFCFDGFSAQKYYYIDS